MPIDYKYTVNLKIYRFKYKSVYSRMPLLLVLCLFCFCPRQPPSAMSVSSLELSRHR